MKNKKPRKMLIPVSEFKTWDVDERVAFVFSENPVPIDNLEFLRTKTRSLVAQYYIMSAYMFDESISFVAGAQRWLRDIKYGSRLHQLRQQAEHTFPDIIDQIIYFTIHTMHYLNFGTAFENKTSLPCCRYKENASNFIKTLVTTRSCNCACLATYVKCVADEFGLSQYIRFCMEESHVSLVIVNPLQTQTHILSQEEAVLLNTAQTLFHIDSTQHLFAENEIVMKPLVIVKIESACDQVIIRTIVEPSAFVQVFLPDAERDNYAVGHSEQIDICQNDLDDLDFYFLVREIVTRTKADQLFADLVLVATIFDQQVWMTAFLRLAICLIEIRWVEYYRKQPLPDAIEDAWEAYTTKMPFVAQDNDLSAEAASRFEQKLVAQSLTLKQQLHALFDKRTGYDKILIVAPLVYGVVETMTMLKTEI